MYTQVVQHMRQLQLSGHQESTPKTGVLTSVLLFIDCLPKGSNGSGVSMIYNCACLLKLLHGCEP